MLSYREGRLRPGRFLTCSLGPVLAGVLSFPAAAGEDAGSHLEFFTQFDGRCQGLRRGDIRMLRNTHPSRAIRYRMVRFVSGVRQGGPIAGRIDPGGEGERLGCSIIDGREQVWTIIKADYET